MNSHMKTSAVILVSADLEILEEPGEPGHAPAKTVTVGFYQDDLHQIHHQEPSLPGSVLQHHGDRQEVGVVEVKDISGLHETVRIGQRQTGLLLSLQTSG